MPDCWRGSTALITGASRGIGAAFADLLAERGADLVVVARDRDALEQVAARVRARGVRAEVVPADLGDSGAPAAIEREVARRGLTVDHLLNNAAIGVHGRFHEVYAAAHPEVINVNVRAPTELAARFLPGMVARRRGGILNVASTAGFQGLAWIPVYSATKAYV
ncbi:MAG TPA: SDR family NAD(P)-dependent oxidoreductase, partial [Streptosporangiaceae bacterium]|nr:SDR family NAD(P)-dependent oxidoreductase [Streptosporangiaceae bacterium]